MRLQFPGNMSSVARFSQTDPSLDRLLQIRLKTEKPPEVQGSLSHLAELLKPLFLVAAIDEKFSIEYQLRRQENENR